MAAATRCASVTASRETGGLSRDPPGRAGNAFAESWNVTDIAADMFAINRGFGCPAAQAWLASIRRL